MPCQPGGTQTLGLFRCSFWGHTMERDVRRFVAGIGIWARGKALHCPPAGLLHPLSIPADPRSHIALDFITGLPDSRGYTTILTIVNRFSKAIHFVPLTKLYHWTGEQNAWYANAHCTPAPEYQVGEGLWLSTKNILLRGETKKMSLRTSGRSASPRRWTQSPFSWGYHLPWESIQFSTCLR